MQVIKRSEHISKLLDSIDLLYSIASERQVNKYPIVLDNTFKGLLDKFYVFGDINYRVNYKNAEYDKIKTKKDNNTVLVAFSGGKDSTALALYYKDKGYNVILYHLKGINLTYKDEYITAQQIANKLNIPLVIEEIQLQGKQEWVEHPMKNMIIANRMIDYAVKNNLPTNISFANFRNSSLYYDPFDVCGGDCKEMWEAYQTIIRRIIPRFKIMLQFDNMGDSLNMLFKHKEVATMPQSCIGAYRYREYLKGKNEAKYKIELPPHRCGSCWKCAVEYIAYCDHDLYEYNKAYYEHCLDVLVRTCKQEKQEKYTRASVWGNYFLYPIEESKYFN